jgi:hypothetical protein
MRDMDVHDLVMACLYHQIMSRNMLYCEVSFSTRKGLLETIRVMFDINTFSLKSLEGG